MFSLMFYFSLLSPAPSYLDNKVYPVLDVPHREREIVYVPLFRRTF